MLLSPLAILLCIAVAECAKIVFFEPFGTQSHKDVYMPMALEMLHRGHNVSFVTFGSDKRFKEAGGIEVTFKQFKIDTIVQHVLGINKSFFEVREKGKFIQTLGQIYIMDRMFEYVAKEIYASKEMREFVEKEKFDLVMLSMFFCDGYLPMIKQWDSPYILMSPAGLFSGVISRLGESESYSTYPVQITSFPQNMNFLQRTVNVLTGEFSKLTGEGQWRKYGEKYAKLNNYYMKDDISKLIKNASMIFLNTHHSFSNIRSFPPTVIEIGGMHCRAAKELDKELEDFVAESGDDGFIIFGLGSAILVSEMPASTQKMFIAAFARLKQRVIWKWEISTGSIPENVKLVKWLPQQDLLGHPKIRGFLSHGGLLSIQETIYHGVPLIGLPFGSDQDLNVAKAVADGYALHLDWNNLSEDLIYETIVELVKNGSYGQRVKFLSTLMRDQPQTPLERAIYWIEYVIRHRGAPHLHSPAKDLSRLQRNLVDVFAFLALIILLCICVVIYVARMLLRCVRRKRIDVKKQS